VTLFRGGAAASSRYQFERAAPGDAALAGAALFVFAIVATMRVGGLGDAGYLAYPAVSAPAFHPLGALAFALLLVPALLAGVRSSP
jgi:hypothetical protein